MRQQIILGRISGLSLSSGLILGFGLSIGGGFSGIIFQGAGGMTVSTIQHGLSQIAFAGAGGLSALPSGRYATNPATFAGSGGLSYAGNLALKALVNFAGTGSQTP
jgi:hypothetical protein